MPFSPSVSMKGYYTQIPVGWLRSQCVMVMRKGRWTWLSDCDVWEVIPRRTPLCCSVRTHMDTQKRPHAALSDMNPPDLSSPANGIVAPGMTAEPLSLSWLLSVETHTDAHKHTYPRKQQCNININININSRWPLGSISLSPRSPGSLTA